MRVTLDAAMRMLRDANMLTRQRVALYSMGPLLVYASLFIWVYWQGDWFRAEDGRLIVTDFVQIPAAGALAAAGRAASIYDKGVFNHAMAQVIGHSFDGYYLWRYPPTLLLMLAVPLSLLPYLTAWFVWIAATAILYVLSLRLILPLRLAVPVALAAPAAFWCAAVGQNGFLTASLMVATLAQLDRRPWLAGVCLGGLSFKPQFGLLLPLLLVLDRRWQTFFSATLTVVLLAAGSVVAFGWDTWQAFAASVSDSTDNALVPGGMFFSKLQSFYAIAYQITGSVRAALLVHFLLCIAILPVVIRLWRRPTPLAVKAASAIAATFLFTPYAFTYDSVMLTAPAACLLKDALDRGFLGWDKLLLCVAWFLPALNEFLASKTVPLTCLLLLFLAARRAYLLPGNGQTPQRRRHSVPMPVGA